MVSSPLLEPLCHFLWVPPLKVETENFPGPRGRGLKAACPPSLLSQEIRGGPVGPR